MEPKAKKALLIAAGAVAAVIIAIVIFVLTFDINRYKPRIEAAATEAAGMKVSIKGALRLELFPLAAVSIEDIRIENQNVTVASVKKAEVELSLLGLLAGKVRIRRAGLYGPVITVVRDKSGRLSFETQEKGPKAGKAPARALEVGKVFVRNGRVVYSNEETGKKVEANGCGLDIKGLSLEKGKPTVFASFDGDLSCREVKADGLDITGLHVVLKDRLGKFEANPVTMKAYGGNGRGSLKGEFSGETPRYSAEFTLSKFRPEAVLEAFKLNASMLGELNMSLNLSVKGATEPELVRSAQGKFSLRSEGLVHKGIDLDHLIEKFENTQRIGIVDMGAFFVAGPLGTLLTKSYDYGRVYTASLGGESGISRFVCDWDVKNGVANAADVAFSTKHNRVAMKGRLDFVNGRYEDVTMAVLDDKGCARFVQKIHGSFRKPVIEKISTIESLAGPVLNLFEKTKGLLGGECKVFYSGSVKQPE